MSTSVRHGRGGVLRDAAWVLAGFTAGGLFAGAVWRWWWTPTVGVVFQGAWIPVPDGSDFSGTGQYVVVALAAGAVLGTLSALVADGREVVTLGLVLLGSVLAAWLMLLVGGLGMPPDPRSLAPSAADGTRLPGSLTVAGWSPLAALPAGALLGLALIYVGFSRNPREEQRDRAPAG